MKNILSENMLRFGAKNLSESNKKRLTLESIIRTINEYGLVEEVKMALNENPLEVKGDLALIFPAGTMYGSKSDTNFYIKTPDGKEYNFGVPFYLTAADKVIEQMKEDGVVSPGESGTLKWNTNYELTKIIGTMHKILNSSKK
jgi:hypothetical protein